MKSEVKQTCITWNKICSDVLCVTHVATVMLWEMLVCKMGMKYSFSF